jgi:hypothetical protein
MRFISGGQQGADIEAIKKAKEFGFATGGTMPKGWVTLDGSKPEYAQLYGMIECDKPGYTPRTYCNVRDSNITIRFCGNFNSPGEICTIQAVNHYKKLCIDIPKGACEVDIKLVAYILWNCAALYPDLIVNVAGNSEKTWPGISKFVQDAMTIILKQFQQLRLEYLE